MKDPEKFADAVAAAIEVATRPLLHRIQRLEVRVGALESESKAIDWQSMADAMQITDAEG